MQRSSPLPCMTVGSFGAASHQAAVDPAAQTFKALLPLSLVTPDPSRGLGQESGQELGAALGLVWKPGEEW